MYAIDIKGPDRGLHTRIVRVYDCAEKCVEEARAGCTIISNIPEEACRDEKVLLKYIDEVPTEEKVTV